MRWRYSLLHEAPLLHGTILYLNLNRRKGFGFHIWMHFFNENRKKNGWRNNSVLGCFSILFWTTILSHYSFTEYLKRSLKMSQIVVRLYVYVEAIIWICQRCESDASMLHLLLRWIRILRLELDGVIATFSCIDRSITNVHVHCSKLKMCSWNHKRTAQNTHTLNWTVAMSPHLEFFPFFFFISQLFQCADTALFTTQSTKICIANLKGEYWFPSFLLNCCARAEIIITNAHPPTHTTVHPKRQPAWHNRSPTEWARYHYQFQRLWSRLLAPIFSSFIFRCGEPLTENKALVLIACAV